MRSQLHYPMLDLTNVQPMSIDTPKPFAMQPQTTKAASTLFKPNFSDCDHSARIQSLNGLHWNCRNCGTFISPVRPDANR